MAEREVRDLVGEDQYYGIDQDKGDPSDPDYWTPERVEKRRLFREWANKQQDAVGNLTQHAAESGMDANTALTRAGFHDAKDQGKYMWSLFSNNGLFAREGAAVDPNLDYNWQTGRATWKPGTDNAGQSRAINSNERDEYNKAQGYRAQGLQGYGQQANATAFDKAKGHFQWNDKLGLYVNPGTAGAGDYGNWQFLDKFGRHVATPGGDLSFLAGDQGDQQGANAPQGAYLPGAPQGSGNSYMDMLNGGGQANSQPFSGAVPAPQNAFNNQQIRQQGAAAKQSDLDSPYQKLLTSNQKKPGAASGQSTALGGF